MQINLNQIVRVRLTAVGRLHLKYLHKRPGFEGYQPPDEVDGLTEFQFWEFIGIFGGFFQVQCRELPCEMNIEIL